MAKKLRASGNSAQATIAALPRLDFGRAKQPRNIHELYAPCGFGVLLLRLERGERPTGPELAAVLEANKDQALPPRVLIPAFLIIDRWWPIHGWRLT